MNINSGFTVVALGEILWDVFPEGARFGGAPANYACHAAAFGCSTAMISAVGQDELGNRALESLSGHGVHTALVQQLADWPTGQVHVLVDANGHPQYQFGADEAWDHLHPLAEMLPLAGRADAVCFGTLGQRHSDSRRVIREFVQQTRPECFRIFDINLRGDYYDEDIVGQSLELANVLKLNEDELPWLASLYHLQGTSEQQLRQVMQRFRIETAALTLGSNGSLLIRGSEEHRMQRLPVDIQDTVGAGDSFTAAMTVGLLNDLDLPTIHDRAARVAAFVCSEAGATPTLPDHLRIFP